MASTLSQIWKAIKPHVPLIKFRKGGIDKSRGLCELPLSSIYPVNAAANVLATSQAQHNPTSNAPAIGYTPRGSGIDEEFLPPRYHRKQMSLLEMEIIERGGPDKL
ncbi:28S ribosomal protein S36-like isoform X1 [Leptotrombidium deliense]|uniref:28S ribosomal protein S36-like isoform X1 n=1 Tax=Leptotrombidium deliense TaxID=299467 RepID=A0A443S7Z5_9ACAR|nr:28S ribosomal protein S36-like isoform X1 [Leptotrombidium deliense]